MYDFAARRGGDTQPDTAPDPLPPSWLLTACELGRFSVELPASLLVDAVVPAPDQGRGRPVLVIPGFSSPDTATRRCRTHLNRLGYRAHGWGLGRNHGLTRPDHRRCAGPLRRPAHAGTTSRSASSAGASAACSPGGWPTNGRTPYARWCASDRRTAPRVSTPAPHRSSSARRRTHGLSDRAFDVVDTLRRPLPVPVSVIYSRSDGIVNWRACALTDGRTGRQHRGAEQPRRPAHEPAVARRSRRSARPGPGRLAVFRLGQLPAAAFLGRPPARIEAVVSR